MASRSRLNLHLAGRVTWRHMTLMCRWPTPCWGGAPVEPLTTCAVTLGVGSRAIQMVTEQSLWSLTQRQHSMG